MPSERVQRQVDRLLDEIDTAVTDGDWEQARDLARDVLTFDSTHEEARAFLKVAERRLGATGTRADAGDPTGVPTAPPSTATAVAAEPSSFANGRYQVKKFLGEGGKKRVYLAHDTVLDRDIAFALIKAESLDDESRARITREAQAMGRLGDHPNIMPIHDLGSEDGQPYMVLPVMPGGDVEGLIADAEDHRLPLEQTLDIAKSVCRGLEFAHEQGIVHRDLKPGNIWLTAGPSSGSGQAVAKIGDFGLAVMTDRSRLTREGMMVGTVSYMPPEQATGGDITPRADLYSLGAMLYEMVTGRPPFLGDNEISIIGQHINTPPVAPSWHRGDCPRPLEALIMRLLAKDPSERPESAQDVFNALDAIDLTAQGETVEQDLTSLESLAGGVFVGRRREMDQLKAALEDALGGRGRLVTLVGEPGIGKTRTAEELATYARLRNAQVLWGRCYEEQGAPPYCPWRQAINAYGEQLDDDALRAQLGPGAPEIAEIVSSVAERFPDLEPPPPLEPAAARFRLFESITAFLKTASREQPLMMILDDLHWADRPSLLLLEYMARELAGTRILVVVTYRDVELSRRHPLSRTLGELVKEASFQRIWLRGLERDDVGRFLEISAGVSPPPDLVRAIHVQTEGNPLFVTEVVRLLVEEGALSEENLSKRQRWSVRIPEGVRVVVGARLDRLSETCNQILTTAAVVGREFGLDLLVSLTASQDGSTETLHEALEEAQSARVIEELPGTTASYRFTHSLIQQTLVEELSTVRRMSLHARVAETIERLYEGDLDAHAADLAFHLARAGPTVDAGELARYALVAGEQALDSYAYEEAIELFEAALARKGPGPVDEQTAPLLFGLGRAQAAVLDTSAAEESLTRAFDYYLELGDTARAVEVARHPVGDGETGVQELVTRALELVLPDSHEAGHLLSHHGFALAMWMGDYEGAQKAFNQALAIAEREGDVALEMWTLARAGRVDHYYLRTQECVLKDGKAAELNRRVNDPIVENYARICVVLSLTITGAPEGALSHAEAMLTNAERTRYRSGLITAIWMKALVHLYKGDWELAREFYDRALSLSPFHPYLVNARPFIEYTVGNFDLGESYLERVLELTRMQPPGSVDSHIAITLADSMTGSVERLGVAKEVARAELSLPTVTPVRAMEANIALGLIAVLQGDRAAAEEHYAALEPLRALMRMDESGFLSLDRLLGLLAQTMGKLDAAAAHFEAAVTFCREAGYRPELAWSCHDYAAMLLAREHKGDRTKAADLQGEAIAMAQELGMSPLLERVLAQREILKA